MIALKILAAAAVYALGVVAITYLIPSEPAGAIVSLLWGGAVGAVAAVLISGAPS